MRYGETGLTLNGLRVSRNCGCGVIVAHQVVALVDPERNRAVTPFKCTDVMM